MTTIAALVREHRARLGYSQERLCALSGVDRGVLSRIEGGRRTGSPATLAKLCKGLGLSAEETVVVHMAAGILPTDVDAGRLRAALALVQTASVAEIAATRELLATARRLAS